VKESWPFQESVHTGKLLYLAKRSSRIDSNKKGGIISKGDQTSRDTAVIFRGKNRAKLPAEWKQPLGL
jgi:hypothetical protein